MFNDQIYVQAKLMEIQNSRLQEQARRSRGLPDAEIERPSVGVVHEVFRRIVEG